MRALVALFNIGQYYNNITEPALITRYYRLISQTFYIPMEDVEQVASSITQTFPRDLSEFVEAVREANISTRLNDLNEVTILNTLSRAWFFTANPGPVIGLAVEYPPAFCALVSMATKYRLFKKTGIGAVVEQNTRRDSHNNHIRAINVLIDQKVGEPHPGKYRDYGMEQYPIHAVAVPDFNDYSTGLESDTLTRILSAAAAGTIAGLLTFGIIKLVTWITGGSGGGSGGGGSSNPVAKAEEQKKDVVNTKQEAKEITTKTTKTIAAANDATKSAGGTKSAIAAAIDKANALTAKIEASTAEHEKQNAQKAADEKANAPTERGAASFAVHPHATDILSKHFHGEQLIAALALLEVCKPSDEDDGEAIAKMLVEIDTKTDMFKNGDYVFAGLVATNRLKLPMLITFSSLTPEGIADMEHGFEEFSKGWNDIIGSVDEIVKMVEETGEASLEGLRTINDSFSKQADGFREFIEKHRLKVEDADIEQYQWVDPEKRKVLFSERSLDALRKIKN
ncbi:MAG: hypothetical protein ACRC8G_11620, partial [Plesiomonas shigelloides]